MEKFLFIDLFCGAGGVTSGIEAAAIAGEKCAEVIACVNHYPLAIVSHQVNHPNAFHFTEDIRTLDLTINEVEYDIKKESSGFEIVFLENSEVIGNVIENPELLGAS